MTFYHRAGGARGVYIHRGSKRLIGTGRSRQLFRIIIAAHDGTRINPQLNVAFGGGSGWRVTLPHFRWTYPMGALRLAAYRASERFWRAFR